MPGGPTGGLPRAPRGSDFKSGTTFQWSYSHNDMVENFIVIQLTFAEIFVPQDFTIRLLLGSVEPQTHVSFEH